MPDVPPEADAATAATDAVAKLHLDDVTGEMISKSELKKRQKAREKEAKKSTQAAAQAQTAGPAQPSFKDATASEKDLTPNQVRP